MVGKIEYRNNIPLSVETERTQNVEQANPSSVQPEKASHNLGVGKSTDIFEQAKLSNSFEQQLPKSPFTGDTAYSVSELRQLISAAKAENKPPFTEANLNKLLSANRDNYKEIAADLKGWINKSMYLSPRQKGPLDRMGEDDLKKVQDSAQTATELNKMMSVKITNQGDISAEKVLKLQETEIGETVKLILERSRQKLLTQDNRKQHKMPLDKASKMQSQGFDMMRRWRSKIRIAILQLVLRTPLWLVALVYTTIAVRMAFVSDQVLVGFPIGLILFSLVEYAIHRWIFHYFEISNPELYDRLHGAHHRKPDDTKRQSVPLFYSFIVAVPVIALSLLGAFGAAIATGFTAGYIIFEVLHAVAHAHWAKRSKVPIVRILVHYHAKHHYKDSKTAYGLSMPLWDLVFRTAATSKMPTVDSGNDFAQRVIQYEISKTYQV